jgi:rhomboid protease GluP
MPVTICLLIANVIVFGVYVFQSSFTGLLTYDGPVLFKMGAAYSPNILFLHQYWRLASSLFLHANLQHICLNMFSLFIFGRMLEKPMGSARFLVLYVFSGLFGGLASMGMHRLDESVGASGAIFGLVGFYVSLQLQMDKKAHPDWTYRIRQLIGIALALYALSLTPGVDHAAHMGGLVTGIICGGAFHGLSDLKVPWCWRDFAITAAFAALFAGTLYGQECTIGEDQAMPAALLLRESVNALQKHDLNGALKKLDNALALDPKNAKALLMQASILARLHRNQEALAACLKVSALEPDNAQAALLRGSINYSLDNYAAALTDTTAALNLDSNDALAYNQRACIYLALGNHYDLALADARRASEIDNHFPEAIDSEAMALAYLGQLDKALPVINRAIEEDNGTGGIYFYHRSEIYTALGDSARAAADLAQAHKLDFALEKWELDRPLPKPDQKI